MENTKTEDLLLNAGETFGYAKLYFEKQIDYAQLEFSKRVAKTTSNLITLATLCLLALIVLLFSSITLTLYLGIWLKSYGLAFLLITIFYFIATVVVFFFKDQLIGKLITSLVIKNLLD